MGHHFFTNHRHHGEVSEWLMVPVLKTGVRKNRGFESHPLRHLGIRDVPSVRVPGEVLKWLKRTVC